MLLTRARARTASVVLSALVATGLSAPPAQAASRVTPGSFTGFAFDTCTTPSNADMDAWRASSPFWGVGVYIGGAELSRCTKEAETKLDAAWVSRQAQRGWRVLPIWVGPQADCADDPYTSRIDTSKRSSYAAARSQGAANAGAAVKRAKNLGIPAGSTLWYDIEAFDNSVQDCRRSVLSFLSSWTKRLHGLGYTSGVYSSVASGIHVLDNADKLSPGSYAMPDQVWYAWANKRANTVIATKWVRRTSWMPHARVHQYVIDTYATYGGVRMEVDRNFLDVGRGSVAPRALATCGVRVDFPDYRLQRRGMTGAQVEAAQCLLQKKRLYGGRVHGRFDAATVRAVRSFQHGRGIRVTGSVDAPTWTALLSDGASPLLKRGSVGDAVRRLQRGLTAALDDRVTVTGVLDAPTSAAVVRYQRARGLTANGVMAGETWADLEAGRR